jgi:hypothetical protein
MESSRFCHIYRCMSDWWSHIALHMHLFRGNLRLSESRRDKVEKYHAAIYSHRQYKYLESLLWQMRPTVARCMILLLFQAHSL